MKLDKQLLFFLFLELKALYKALELGSQVSFWKSDTQNFWVLPWVGCFAWKVAWSKILTSDHI